VFGLIVGAIAKFLMPGRDPGGIFITMGIGIAGSLIGGFVASAFGLSHAAEWSWPSVIISVGGAVLLLAAYRAYKSR
jgi:uncharacterized membrane protein YeaQ/YmgE (transglycosylase-associated protein family)